MLFNSFIRIDTIGSQYEFMVSIFWECEIIVIQDLDYYNNCILYYSNTILIFYTNTLYISKYQLDKNFSVDDFTINYYVTLDFSISCS